MSRSNLHNSRGKRRPATRGERTAHFSRARRKRAAPFEHVVAGQPIAVALVRRRRGRGRIAGGQLPPRRARMAVSSRRRRRPLGVHPRGAAYMSCMSLLRTTPSASTARSVPGTWTPGNVLIHFSRLLRMSAAVPFAMAASLVVPAGLTGRTCHVFCFWPGSRFARGDQRQDPRPRSLSCDVLAQSSGVPASGVPLMPSRRCCRGRVDSDVVDVACPRPTHPYPPPAPAL